MKINTNISNHISRTQLKRAQTIARKVSTKNKPKSEDKNHVASER